jgi:hypothetical protein
MKEGKLDIKMLEEKGNYVGATVPTDDGYQKTTTFRIEKTLDNGTYIYIRGNELSGYSKRITKKNNLITTSYGYYPSGNLKQITYLYPNLVKKGTWYWYNERGQINRLEEYDKPYKYTWEEVLTFIQQKEIKKEDIYKILRWVDEKTKHPYWSLEVTLKRDYNNNTILTQYYKLNGNTGSIVEEKEKEYIYEER